MESDECSVLVSYLCKKVYPSDYTKIAKRALRQKAASFLLINGELWHKGVCHTGSLESDRSETKLKKVRMYLTEKLMLS